MACIAAERMERASTEIADREYDFGKLLSDVLGFWDYGIRSCYDTMYGARIPPVPLIYLVAGDVSQVCSADLCIQVPVDADVESTDLYGLEDGCRHPGSRVKFSFDKENPQILTGFTIQDLQGLDPQAYVGLIHAADVPLAKIMLDKHDDQTSSHSSPNKKSRSHDASEQRRRRR